MNDAIISFDGNCDPNPGSGGSGSLIGINGKWYGISTNCSMTTNNREEIKGLIEGIKFLIDKKITGNSLIVIGDSEYVLNSCCHWIWKSQNKKHHVACFL